ncbi:MAG: Uma2 family endonuclease [Cyclobacteriaceae bacterium]
MDFQESAKLKEFRELDLGRLYSYAEYLTWSFKERVELLRGKVVKMSPAPSLRHQEISFRMSGAFFNALKNGDCKAFAAPFDVRLAKPFSDQEDILNVVQPDLCVICDNSKLDDRGCLGAPDLIVEILSPGSADKDVKQKYQLYEEGGVAEYWIIHPNEMLLEVFVLINGKYNHDRWYSANEKVNSKAVKGLSVDLSEVF